MFFTVEFPNIISLSRRPSTWLAAIALLVSLSACSKSPVAPPPGPQPLTVACPANISTNSVGGQPVTLAFELPSATGGSGPLAISCNPASGALFSPGTTTVTCTATDGGGRAATCGFVINVAHVPVLARTRFLAFGDSLTEGKVSLVPSILVDAGPHSYPARLRGLLSARYTSQTITMANEGWGGERADEAVPRFRGAMSQHRPDVVLLMHGVNDLISASPGRVQTAADGVEELVKEGRNAGAVVFVATLPPFGNGPKASCQECVEPYNSHLRAIAAAKGATLVDVHAAWAGRSGLMGADGIHPTDAGYEVIATTFFEVIQRTLENPVGALR